MPDSQQASNPTPVAMDDLVSLCKRRGFIFQSSEIYGGVNGFFDYGPLGVELRRNIKDAWWRDFVHRRDDMVGLDASIIMHPDVWKASGHVDNFTDPMVDCKESKQRFRADHLFWAPVVVGGETVGYVSVLESPGMEATAAEAAARLLKARKIDAQPEPLALRDYTVADPSLYEKIPSPATGQPGSLTPPRSFNMMFDTHIGALRDDSSVAYLRPETAQGIFANFKNVLDTSRVKLPFGIAQIGKAFRNEITPRNFIFRSREFEQMEIEYFIAPTADWRTLHREWIDACIAWLESIGVPRSMVNEDVHPTEKLAFYSQATTDLTFHFPFGEQELWGIACRSDYDLKQHQEHSGKAMDYFEESTRERFVPHVIEPSLGVDRTLLAVLCAAYAEDEIGGEKRNFLRFHPRVAPVKVAVFPLVKNKPPIVEAARRIQNRLSRRWNVVYDQTGAIGRRYRRQDEIGTPYCVTVDFDTIEKDGTVTLRDRDTTTQVRVSEDALMQRLESAIEGHDA